MCRCIFFMQLENFGGARSNLDSLSLKARIHTRAPARRALGRPTGYRIVGEQWKDFVKPSFLHPPPPLTMLSCDRACIVLDLGKAVHHIIATSSCWAFYSWSVLLQFNAEGVPQWDRHKKASAASCELSKGVQPVARNRKLKLDLLQMNRLCTSKRTQAVHETVCIKHRALLLKYQGACLCISPGHAS